MFELLIKGGPVMVPICLSALAATVIIIERALFFRAISRSDASLYGAVRRLVAEGRFSDAERECDGSDSPLARLLRAGIDHREYSEADLKEAVMNAANREVPRLERYLNTLGTIANVSTLLGLLGTVTGNIKAFGVLASSGAIGNPALLAGAIAEALITTAAGLIVSIPATIFYNYYVSRANKIVVEMESSVGDLSLMLVGKKPEARGAL